ncbi:MAG: hypothetical protein OEO79_14740 [Gemmatimonadota bacterium]|nr:hypothetical protein [Gemmatimonadota bacterium]
MRAGGAAESRVVRVPETLVAIQPSDPSRAEDQYHRGLAELHRYLFHFEAASLPRAVEAFRSATETEPDNAGYWAGLGFVLDASDLPREALAAFRHAREVNPDDEEVEVFILTLLSELGPEREALAAVEALAERDGIDLDSLREELTAAGMPVDARALLMNGFIRARNFLRSRLEDDIERSERTQNPDAWSEQVESERQDCAKMRKELEHDIDPQRVPAGLRDVTPWAIRLGIGDDVCRNRLLEGLTTGERAAMLGAIRQHAASIHSWLDAFGNEPMTPEATAFMYLLLGADETSEMAS